MKQEKDKNDPTIFDEINAEFNKNSEFTVEGIAEKMGISNRALMSWMHGDLQFNRELERFLETQRVLAVDDEFESKADAMILAFILQGTRERKRKTN
jgi:hypothetical protein